MDIASELLVTLATVVDAGTFDAAAQRLRVTPSAVSQRIKALEQQLGRVVLERTKPVRPTASGEVLLRLARQIERLQADACAALGLEIGETPSVALAVNADSLATWFLPALAPLAAEGVRFELFREDQDHTVTLLEDGSVMAAVTSSADPVPGCVVSRLGGMEYVAMAAPAFRDRWFPQGFTADALATAPLVDFDRRDKLQSRVLRRLTRRPLDPPRHFVPSSTDFAEAAALGFGWVMLPPLQVKAHLAAGRLVRLQPAQSITVPLYWQQWRLESPLLARVAAAVAAAAARSLA
ncbi:LysR family transcriptional regulator ArgP [Nannocystis sp. ILAH1]|uniref:LysR family transcriptional regulator ArgP n=1 Tax=Nannocystis sp. ILAH1 TaxID=2996789 RepID=UPI00226E121F|nr:LysR family transcriptional regulator ArgP [Nannocystis sp. ILAH1]MCY0990990.1 LysR family transcriptional regulator ArgP [Nannocystis sp. ILAH1]